MTKKYQVQARVISNEEIASGIFEMALDAPEVAHDAQPGQFVHVRVAYAPVQFLRMPFCVYKADASTGALHICYAVVGEGTSQLAGLFADDEVDVIGPVGNGWSVPKSMTRALLVAGGAGAPAVHLLAGQLAATGIAFDMVLGAASADKLICIDEMRAQLNQVGGELKICTDDGTAGTHGFVTAETDGLIASGEYDYVAVCGPTPMMANVVKPALAAGVSCQVSMEKLMACGLGACLSCIVETRDGRKRCCVDGPVFDASEVVW